MSKVTFLPGAQPPQTPDWMVGPFESYAIRLEGRRIPGLEGKPLADGTVNLILDGRYCINLPAGTAGDVAWFVAQALAIGSGYTHLSAETKGRPFAPQMIEIGTVTTEPDSEADEEG